MAISEKTPLFSANRRRVRSCVEDFSGSYKNYKNIGTTEPINGDTHKVIYFPYHNA